MPATADIRVEFTCINLNMMRDKVEHLPFAANVLAAETLGIEEGSLEPGRDECELPEYRAAHGLWATAGWPNRIPEGLTRYVARIRLTAMGGGDVTRKRIIAVPFGDHDVGFAIDRIG